VPFSPSPYLPALCDFPLLTVVEGEKFVIQYSKESLPIEWPKYFPDLQVFYGGRAIQDAEHWKRIHTLAERCYRPWKKAQLALLKYDKTGAEHDQKNAVDRLEDARSSFVDFWRDAARLPETVYRSPPLDLAPNIHACFNVLLKIVLLGCNHSAFPESVDLMRCICDWLLSCLTRADDVLEGYFAMRKRESINGTL
jgi:hypothetical protein